MGGMRGARIWGTLAQTEMAQYMMSHAMAVGDVSAILEQQGIGTSGQAPLRRS